MNKVIPAICVLFLGYAAGITNQKNETAEAAASETVNRREAPPEFLAPPSGGGISNSYGPPSPSDSYGPPPSGPPTGIGPSGTYGPPKPVYGPPSDTYGPPPDIGSPPTGSYGPPPGDIYGPPPGDSYLPPSRPSGPKPVYGPPPSGHVPSFSIGGLKPPSDSYGPPDSGPPLPIYGPPNLRPPKLKPVYGPPKSIYGPPKPSFGNGPPISGPPKPVYGPPKNFGGGFFKPPSSKPSFGPPKPIYGPPPKSIYGPPSKPKPSFGPPKNNYGPPPKPSFGHSKPKPVYGPPNGHGSHGPPGVPSPPTPPEISYDGWQPIPGISHAPGDHAAPSDSYGPPVGHGPPGDSYGPPVGHGPPGDTYGPPSDGHSPLGSIGIGHGTLDGGLNLPSVSYGPPSDSYGPPNNDPGALSSNYGPPPSIPSSSYGGPPPPLPDHHDHHSGTYDGPPPPLPHSPPLSVKPVYGVPNVGGDSSSLGGLSPPKTSYGVPSGLYGAPASPPSGSYGPPAPPSGSYGPPSAPPSGSYGPPSAPPSGSYGPPSSPGGSYGPPPPSDSYGPPSGHDSNLDLLKIFSSGQGDSSGSITSDLTPPGGAHNGPSGSYGPPPSSYGPPPSDNYGPPPSDNYGPPSGSYGPPQGNFGVQLSSCCGTPPPDIGGHEHKSDLPLAYGVPSGMQIEGPNIQPKVPIKFRDPVPKGLLEAIGESAEYKTSGQGKPFHGGTYIPPSVPEVPQHHPDDDHNHEEAHQHHGHQGGQSFQNGHPAVDLSPPQLQQLDVSNNYGPPPAESNGNHLEGGGADLLHSLGLEGTDISKSISHEYTPNSLDIPVHGNQGSYTLNIQSANGEPHGNIPHGHVLSNGLLQDILAAIEHQPTSVQQVQPSYGVVDAHPSGTEEHSVNTIPSESDLQRFRHENREETMIAQETVNHESRSQIVPGQSAVGQDKLDSNTQRLGGRNSALAHNHLAHDTKREFKRHPLAHGFTSSGIALYFNPEPKRNESISGFNSTSSSFEDFNRQRFETSPLPRATDSRTFATTRSIASSTPNPSLSAQPEGSYVNFDSPSNKYSYDITGKSSR